MRIALACCLLSCVSDVGSSLMFFLLFPFSISIWTSFVFHPVFFLWVLCCLLGFRFLLRLVYIAYDTMYFDTKYARTLISPFSSCLRYTICSSYCVIIFGLYFVFLLR